MFSHFALGESINKKKHCFTAVVGIIARMRSLEVKVRLLCLGVVKKWTHYPQSVTAFMHHLVSMLSVATKCQINQGNMCLFTPLYHLFTSRTLE